MMPIPSAPGYLASECGRIWSERSGRFLSSNPRSDGYCYVSIRVNGRNVVKAIHRMVAEAYIYPDTRLVRHYDDVKHNNRPENLLYGTHRDNGLDAVRNGRRAKGSKHANAKLTEPQVLEMRRLWADKWTGRELAAKFGVSEATVYRIVTGHGWTHVTEGI